MADLDRVEELERRRALLMEWLYSLQDGNCECPETSEIRGDGRPSRMHAGCRWSHFANRVFQSLLVDLKASAPTAWNDEFNVRRDVAATMGIPVHG